MIFVPEFQCLRCGVVTTDPYQAINAARDAFFSPDLTAHNPNAHVCFDLGFGKQEQVGWVQSNTEPPGLRVPGSERRRGENSPTTGFIGEAVGCSNPRQPRSRHALA